MSTGMPIGDGDPGREVQGEAGILTVRAGQARRTWNGIQYLTGLSGKNVGASQLSMNVATIPPGGIASAHIHVGFEVMLYILEGRVRHEYGPGCQRIIDNEAGDFIFIAPGVPHEVVNLSDTDPVVAVVARSDASEWEHIIRYDRAQARPATD
ncbi:MAG TPA: cupin domain-containing protein [bacterium]|nr:cupin domain-containing protein [bacterium]